MIYNKVILLLYLAIRNLICLFLFLEVFVPLLMRHSSYYQPQNLAIAVHHDEVMKPPPLPADNFKPVTYETCFTQQQVIMLALLRPGVMMKHYNTHLTLIMISR